MPLGRRDAEVAQRTLKNKNLFLVFSALSAPSLCLRGEKTQPYRYAKIMA